MRVPHVNTWSLRMVTVLAACHGDVPPASNPDARLVRHSTLLYPGACAWTEIIGVAELDHLRAQTEDALITPSLVRGGWFHAREFLSVCGIAPGAASVDLLNGGAIVDTLSVEVALLDSLAIGAGSNVFDDTYPTIPAPVGLLVDQPAILYVAGITEDGRTFDVAFDDAYEASVDGPVEFTFNYGAIFELHSAVAGSYPMTLTGGSVEHVVNLLIVSQDEVEHIEVSVLELPNGSGSYAVTGVTADGLHVVGLNAELTTDGSPSLRGPENWLFIGPYAQGASVVATWNGLSATLP